MEENLDRLQTPILQEASVLSDVYENEAYYIQNKFSLIESDEIFQGTDHLTLRVNMDLSLPSDEAVLPEWENFSLNIHRDTLSSFAEQSEAISICFTNPKIGLNEPLVGNYEGLSDLFKIDSFSNTLKNSFEWEGNTIFGFPNSDIGQLNFGNNEFVDEYRLVGTGLDLSYFNKSSLDEIALATGVSFLKTEEDYISAQLLFESSITQEGVGNFMFPNKKELTTGTISFEDYEIGMNNFGLYSEGRFWHESVTSKFKSEINLLDQNCPKNNLDEEFIEMLSEVHIDLVDIYKGLYESYSTKCSDYRRHTSHALRELISHTISELAPSNVVEKWLKDTSRNNKDFLTDRGPTRKGRIFYVFRDRSKKEKKLAEKQIITINELYNFLNKPSHVLKSDLLDNLLKNYIEKTKNSLETILILLKN